MSIPVWLSQLRRDAVLLLPCSFHSGIETTRTVIGPDERGVTVMHTRSTCLQCGRQLKNGLTAGPDPRSSPGPDGPENPFQ